MPELTLDDFFQGRDDSRQLFDAILRQVERFGPATIRVLKSQVAFRRSKNFAAIWIPGQYLKDRPTAPLVLTLSFRERDPSPRWKAIIEITPRRFTHHLELYEEQAVDGEVFRWLQKAWNEAV